jgi:hypothetical protein
MGITSYEERSADRLVALERRFEALIIQDRTGSKKFGVGRVPFGGATGILNDDANLVWDNTNKRLGVGTNTPNTRLDIRGTDSNYGSGPHIDFTTNADTHRQLQFLAFAHDNVNITFDAYFNGANWVSSHAGSNFQLRKSSTGLRVYGASGVTVGSTVTWNEQLAVGAAGIQIGGNAPNYTTAFNASLANNGIMPLGVSGVGFAFVWAGSAVAMYAINGGAHTTTELLDPSSIFTTVASTASSINIYWSAGNARYELENKRGSAIGVRVWLFDSA